jgi:hypothetical protein
MIKNLYNFQVLVSGEGNDHVSGSETGMHSTLHGFNAEGGRNTFGGGNEAILFTGVRDVIHAHAIILTLCDAPLS